MTERTEEYYLQKFKEFFPSWAKHITKHSLVDHQTIRVRVEDKSGVRNYIFGSKGEEENSWRLETESFAKNTEV